MVIEKATAERLRAEGASFYDWNPPHDMPGLVREGEGFYRLVTSWSTERADVERFCALIA